MANVHSILKGSSNKLYTISPSAGFVFTTICCVKTEDIDTRTSTISVLYLTDLGTRSFFQGLLSAHFLSMDRYRSIAHFADFQVRSSLNRSKKKPVFRSRKRALKRKIAPKTTAVRSYA